MENREEVKRKLLEIIKEIDENKNADIGFEAIAGILTTVAASMSDDIELMELTKAIFAHVEKRTGKGPTFLPPNEN